MGLTLLLSCITPLVSKVFGSLTGINKIHSSIFDLFSSGVLNGQTLPSILNTITSTVSQICNDKNKIEELKIGLLELCKTNEFKEYEQDTIDRASARATYTALSATGKTPWEAGVISAIGLIGYVSFILLISVLYLVYHHHELSYVFNSAATTLFTMVSTITAFWLGSNRANDAQQQLVTALQNSTPALPSSKPVTKPSMWSRFRHPIQSARDVVDEKIDETYRQAEKDV